MKCAACNWIVNDRPSMSDDLSMNELLVHRKYDFVFESPFRIFILRSNNKKNHDSR
jgi:hypothetical protein